MIMNDRMIPQIPPTGEVMRILIYSDVATEIDDLYALTIAFGHPERFFNRRNCCGPFFRKWPLQFKKKVFRTVKGTASKIRYGREVSNSGRLTPNAVCQYTK